MKTDYTGKVDTGLFSFMTEVSKEIVHQTTGHVFAEDEKKSVLADTSVACAEAFHSAVDQQASLEKEMSDDIDFGFDFESDSDTDFIDSLNNE